MDRAERSTDDDRREQERDDAGGDPLVPLLPIAAGDEALERAVGRSEPLHCTVEEVAFLDHVSSPAFSRIAARARVESVRTVLARMPSIFPASSDVRPT